MKNTNISKLVYSNEKGIRKRSNGIKEQIKFFIFEYQEKRDLLQYAEFGPSCGERKCIKFYFKKILETVQEIHKIGIFHLDINLNNILVNENYEPILSDFGLSQALENCNNGKLIDIRGTPHFMSPQIEEKKEYDGIQSDIYSLGISLFLLVVGYLPFENELERKEYYNKNSKAKKKKFWDGIKKSYKIKLSAEFINLFSIMISYEEKDRPSIKNILEDKWFEEVKNLNFNDVEDELRTLFSQKEQLFIRYNLKRDKPKNKSQNINQESQKIEKEQIIYFPEGIKIIKERPEINMDTYLRINEIKDIVDFMNMLANKYKNGFCDSIEESKKDLKFNAIFEKKEVNEENDDKSDNSENSDKNEKDEENDTEDDNEEK